MVRYKMTRGERAKQFMPFAALKGHTEALRRKEKIVVDKIELSEEYLESLNREMMKVKKGDIVTIIYYCKNEYLKLTGMVSRMDETAKILKIVNTRVAFADIYAIMKERKFQEE